MAQLKNIYSLFPHPTIFEFHFYLNERSFFFRSPIDKIDLVGLKFYQWTKRHIKQPTFSKVVFIKFYLKLFICVCVRKKNVLAGVSVEFHQKREAAAKPSTGCGTVYYEISSVAISLLSDIQVGNNSLYIYETYTCTQSKMNK